ncbi:MAG: site-specific integrase, partial [Desulfovibrio sp.]|nr:site-specific integrase [Desulfovibrio sp.]
GSKRWESRVFRCGKRIRIGLGVWPEVSIKEARKRHEENRKQAGEGHDPRLSGEMSFGELHERWYQSMRPSWGDAHVAQRRAHYETYIAGKIGSLPAAWLEPQDIVRVVSQPSLKGKQETARRVFQSIAGPLKYGRGIGAVQSDPSRDLEVQMILQPSHGKRHFAAQTDHGEIGRFMQHVWNYPHSPVVRAALLMTVWTAGRSQEVLGAQWEEIDLESATWTVPAGRMKRRREHRVPLSRQALELLRELKDSSRSAWGFPSARSASKHLSDGALLAAIRDLGWNKEQMTPHGCRAMFSTYANADGQWEADIIEAQLSHADKNSVRAAYNRSEFLERRRALMQWYADELDRLRLGLTFAQTGFYKQTGKNLPSSLAWIRMTFLLSSKPFPRPRYWKRFGSGFWIRLDAPFSSSRTFSAQRLSCATPAAATGITPAHGLWRSFTATGSSISRARSAGSLPEKSAPASPGASLSRCPCPRGGRTASKRSGRSGLSESQPTWSS